MTYDARSLDDLPLAAYGGSGMELTPEDQARIEAADVTTEAVDAGSGGDPANHARLAPGPFAHALPGGVLPDDNVGAARLATPPFAGSQSLPPVVANVVTTFRTSRLASGATFVGVILVGLLLLNGGARPSAAGAEGSPSPAPVVSVTSEPGNATLVLTGKVQQSLTLLGMTGTGAPGSPLAVTWTDAAGNTLALTGAPDRGTRTTDEALVLAFTVAVDGEPVSFTSTDGECTVGMAVSPFNLSGSFTCKKLKSDDGKLTVGATGTYRT